MAAFNHYLEWRRAGSHPSRTNHKLQTYTWWLAFVVLSNYLVFHFTMLIITLLPSSPLQSVVIDAANRYALPFFSQNWSFFAPVPVDKTMSLIVRGRLEDPHSGAVEESGWSDVNEPLINQLRASRTSALALVQLGLSNAVIDYVNNVSASPEAVTTDEKGNKVLRSPMPRQIDPIERQVLEQAGLSSLQIQYPHRRVKDYQLGILIREFPRFVQRELPDSASRDSLLLLDWQSAHYVPLSAAQWKTGSRRDNDS